jgi:hypothetical protein
MLKVNLDFILQKTGAHLNLKVELESLHISPGVKPRNIGKVRRYNTYKKGSNIFQNCVKFFGP